MQKSIFWTLLLCITAQAGYAEVGDPAADMIINGGTVVTMGRVPTAEALAIRDGLIIGVGTDSEVLALRGPDTQMVDATGMTILPGFQDSHIHPVGLGRYKNRELDLLGVHGTEELVRGLSSLKQKLKPAAGEWLLGNRWDASFFDPLFTRWDLDTVAPNNPVKLSRYRGVGVNTAVFEMMGIKDNDPSTWPQWWLEDPANFTQEDTIYREPRKIEVNGVTKIYNVPTGVFIGSNAVRLITVRPPRPSLEDDVESVRLGSMELLKVGITSVIDAGNGMGYNTRVYTIAREKGFLHVRIPQEYEGIFFTQSPKEIRAHFEHLPRNLGDSHLRLRGIKIYADGGPSARGSWLTKPYEPLPGTPADAAPYFGVPVVADYAKREAQYRAFVDYGWDLHTHATGDAAIAQTVRLYKKLEDEILAENPDADLRWSVEHANLPLETPGVVETMAKYGIFASVQPIMISALGHAWTPNIGGERMARSIPVKSYMEHGVVVVAGSDWSITPYDPWLGIYAMVTRKDLWSGKVYGAKERVSLMDALKTYTINGAYVTYQEDIRGSLDVGKVADFVILALPDLSEFERNPELLRTASDRVVATFVDGVPWYKQPGTGLFD